MATTTADYALPKKLDSVRLPDDVYSKVRTFFLVVMALGWLASIAGYFLESGHAEHGNRFFQSYLFAFTYATTIPLGAWFFVQVMYLAGNASLVPVRRILETLMVIIPVGFVLSLPVAFGIHDLYPWAGFGHGAGHLPPDKAAYLSPTGFFIRMPIYFILWGLWTRVIYNASTSQDKDGSLTWMHKCSRWSAPGLLVAMLSVSLAAFDLLMSLLPTWYSTIFGLYVFAGGAWAMWATVILISRFLQSNGVLKNVIRVEHYHDMGKWQFALTVFWTYIAFSQFMLIWYANLPEETQFYNMRLKGSWEPLSYFLLYGHFVLPFLVLIFRGTKRNPGRLALVAVWALFVHLCDHYWLVMPNFFKDGIHFHWLDISCLMATVGTYGFVFWTQFKKNNVLPVGDARFEQGLHFQNL